MLYIYFFQLLTIFVSGKLTQYEDFYNKHKDFISSIGRVPSLNNSGLRQKKHENFLTQYIRPLSVHLYILCLTDPDRFFSFIGGKKIYLPAVVGKFRLFSGVLMILYIYFCKKGRMSFFSCREQF